MSVALNIVTVASTTPLTVRQLATGATIPAAVLDGSDYVPADGDRVIGAMFIGNRFTILGSLKQAASGAGGTVTAADIEALFTASGQLFVGTGSGTGTLLAKGTTGKVLTAGASTLSWTPAPAPTLAQVEALFTAAGQLIVGTGTGTGTALAKGTTGKVLTAGSTGLAWTPAPAPTAAQIEATFTTAGQLYVGSGSGTGSLLTKGASGKVLTAGSSTISWATPVAPTAAQIEATFGNAGELYVGTGTGTGTKLAKGTTGKVLTATSTGVAWSTTVVTLAEVETVFTAAGQLLLGTGSGTGTLLAKGSSGQVLAVGLSGVTWGTVTVAPPSASQIEATFSAAGQIYVGTGTSTGVRLAKGTTGQVLTAGSSTISWATPVAPTAAQIEATFTTAGQLYVGSGSGTGTLLAKGTSGKVLTAGATTAGWTPIPAPTLAQIEALFTANGQLIGGTGSGTGTLMNKGSTGTVLTAGASGIAWTPIPAQATITMTTRSSNRTAFPGETSVCTSITTAITITLPTSPALGTVNRVIVAGSKVVTVACGGTNKVFYGTALVASFGLAPGMSVMLAYDGTTKWYVIDTNGYGPHITATVATATITTAGSTKTQTLITAGDVRGGIVITSGKIVVPIAGLYRVSAQGTWTTAITGHPIRIGWTNGPTVFAGVTGTASQAKAVFDSHFTAGQSIAFHVKQTTGSTIKLRGGAGLTYFTVAWVQP